MDTIPQRVENEISGATTLGTSLATRCKYKLQYGLEEEQQTHSPVTREIAGAAPVRFAKLLNFEVEIG